MPCEFVEGVDANGVPFRAFQCTLYEDGLEPMERLAIDEMQRQEEERERDLQGRTALEHLALVDAYLDAVDDGFYGTMDEFDECWVRQEMESIDVWGDEQREADEEEWG